MVLLIASRDTRIGAVIAISPSAFIWPGFDPDAPLTAPDMLGWTESGKALPFIPSDPAANAADAKTMAAGGSLEFRHTFDASLAAASASQRAAATIPVERIAAPILCIAGKDDRIWNAAATCEDIVGRRRAVNLSVRDGALIAPDSGHSFRLDGTTAPSEVAVGAYKVVLGGTSEANARSGRDAWERIMSFLKMTFSSR